uniref:Protein CHUP1, chloroplastic n=1 Tax=Anthurium amnicola TaxID=1678845 RepID=A0A1D1ZL62_9ARAE
MGLEEWLAMGRREAKPLLIKVGVAFSLSLAGYLYARLSSRAADSPPRHHPPATIPRAEGGGRRACGGLKDELLQRGDATSNVVNGANPLSASSASPAASSNNPGEEAGCLLPEFIELVLRELESVAVDADAMGTRPAERPPENEEEKLMQQEIAGLKDLVQSLRERESSLEIQLLEFYGLKEQESTVLELENRVKMGAMEAEMLSLKVESLLAENRRLEAQASDYSRTKAELESARAKIKRLRRKLKSESVQAKEKVATLHQRVAALQDLECRVVEKEEEELQGNLMRLKDLEHEAAELERANSRLAMENSDLAEKLESAQILASTALESPEATTPLEESNCLREKNVELTREIEQLRTDRCADVEELVYLRWVNACLRHELRNYRPGKAAARDLSRTLSPKSEHGVKQLILEYANSGPNDKASSTNLMDSDSEKCPSSRASSLTEIGEAGDASTDASIAPKKGGSGKTKFFTKLKRLVLGKDYGNHRDPSADSPTSCVNSARRASVLACSFDDVIGRSSYDSAASCVTSDNGHENPLMAAGAKADEPQQSESPWTRDLSRVSLDFQRLKSHEEQGKMAGEQRSGSDVGASWQPSMAFCEGILLSSPRGAGPNKEASGAAAAEQLELGESARASKGRRGKNPKMRLRSASFSSC